MHRDEIHSKLVQIMKERLLVHLRGLPQIVETWHRSDEADVQPSQFARNLTKVNELWNYSNCKKCMYIILSKGVYLLIMQTIYNSEVFPL